MPAARRPSTIEVTRVATGPDGTVEIDVKLVVEARRLIDVTAEMMRLGVTNLRDLEASMRPPQDPAPTDDDGRA